METNQKYINKRMVRNLHIFIQWNYHSEIKRSRPLIHKNVDESQKHAE